MIPLAAMDAQQTVLEDATNNHGGLGPHDCFVTCSDSSSVGTEDAVHWWYICQRVDDDVEMTGVPPHAGSDVNKGPRQENPNVSLIWLFRSQSNQH